SLMWGGTRPLHDKCSRPVTAACHSGGRSDLDPGRGGEQSARTRVRHAPPPCREAPLHARIAPLRVFSLPPGFGPPPLAGRMTPPGTGASSQAAWTPPQTTAGRGASRARVGCGGVRTIDGVFENVVAYCRHRITNAVTEGRNEGIATLQKRAYGF